MKSSPTAMRSDGRSARAVEAWLTDWIEGRLDLPPGRLDRDLPLRRLGVRSLHVAELMLAVEEAFGVELDPAELMMAPTVAGLADYLTRPDVDGAPESWS